MAVQISSGDGDLKTAIESLLVAVGWTQDASGVCVLGGGRDYEWVTYKSDGESGAEDLTLGLAYLNPDPGGSFATYRGLQLYMMEDSPPNGCCIIPWMVGGISGVAPNASTGAAQGIPTIPLGPGSGDDGGLGRYWLVCDLDALLVVVRVDQPGASYYQPAYAGLLSRYQPPASDPRPALVLAGSDYSALKHGIYGGNWPFAQMTCPSTSAMVHLRDLADSAWNGYKGVTYSYPQVGVAQYMVVSSYTNRLNQPWSLGGGRSLMPISAGPAYDPDAEGLRGRVKHAWHVSSEGLEEEEIITVGGNDYKAFPPPASDGPADTTVWLAIRWYE